jgi:hypothetical protein
LTGRRIVPLRDVLGLISLNADDAKPRFSGAGVDAKDDSHDGNQRKPVPSVNDCDEKIMSRSGLIRHYKVASTASGMSALE